MFALDFPEINSILRWKDIFPGFNKIALIAVLAAVISSVIFLLALALLLQCLLGVPSYQVQEQTWHPQQQDQLWFFLELCPIVFVS